MHKPTGLYVYGAFGQKQDDNRFGNGVSPLSLGPNPQIDRNDTVWYIQPGIEKKWLPLGTTTVFGTYRNDNNGTRNTFTTVTGLPLAAGTYYTSGSEVKTWGGGVVQNIEAAAMDLYLIYSHVDGEFTCGQHGQRHSHQDRRRQHGPRPGRRDDQVLNYSTPLPLTPDAKEPPRKGWLFYVDFGETWRPIVV